MEETKDEKLTSEHIADFYGKEIEALADPVTLDSMIALSKAVSKELEDYRHSDF